MALSAEDKALLNSHIAEAKKALYEDRFQDYWVAVNKAGDLIGSADGDEEHEDKVLDKISRSLGGPPWVG
jgi:hypothetical protein